MALDQGMIYIYISVYIYVYACIHIYIYVCVYKYRYVYIYSYVYVYVCLYTWYMFQFYNMSVRLTTAMALDRGIVYMYLHICTCMYV
jgi:hypothetical protein